MIFPYQNKSSNKLISKEQKMLIPGKRSHSWFWCAIKVNLAVQAVSETGLGSWIFFVHSKTWCSHEITWTVNGHRQSITFYQEILLYFFIFLPATQGLGRYTFVIKIMIFWGQSSLYYCNYNKNHIYLIVLKGIAVYCDLIFCPSPIHTCTYCVSRGLTCLQKIIKLFLTNKKQIL